MQICQLEESVNEQELIHMKMLSIFPQLGQSIALQYQLDGNFQMLPIKLYPSFTARHSVKKLELTLKVENRLPEAQRAKWMRISFKFPMRVHKVNFTNLQQDQTVLSFKDIKDIESLNRVAASWLASTSTA